KRFKEFEGSEWKRYKQNQVAHFYNGRAYKLSEWEEIGTPVIRLQNLTGTGKNFYYSNLELPEHQYVNSGDLLYMWSATFGPHIWQGERAIYHYHIWKVVCNDNLLSKNFFYFLLDFETQQKMSKSNGMGILHITKSTMESTQVILPSLPEQEKIAAVLSAADEEISTLEKQLAAYKQQKLGLMQQLLTGRIRI
ncbi:restriction endonuclease subunit S, partial [Chamaesiphon sp. VAR_48_metabat_135_sub]|uniref:restriction endonuclease subunit S n=1 Tax=Chamaesiphon sp. VAR_48_metabat_135_sub TaxID=2964699 RepID=UPI00286B78C0